LCERRRVYLHKNR